MKHKKKLGPMGHYWYTPEEFRAIAGGTEAPKNGNSLAIRSYVTVDSIEKAAGDDRTLRFTISTASVDRQRDTINQGGWRLDNYLKNPVVLFGHDYGDLPVAQATAVRVEGGKLIAEAKFCDPETYPFADTVYKMLLGGFLRATSVGFNPLKWMWNEERRGVDYEEQELLEFSVVPVPANPEALMAASAAGINLAPMKDWVTSVLKSGGESMGLDKEQLNGIVETLERAVPQQCTDATGADDAQATPVVIHIDSKEVARIVAEAIKPIQDSLDALKASAAASDVDEQLLDILDEQDVVLEMADEPDADAHDGDELLDLNEEDVKLALASALKDGVQDIVKEELDRLRGRLV